MHNIQRNRGYDLIYIDPPWRYSFSRSSSRRIENQYPTMTMNDIASLRVPANKNCVMYMWATAPKLLEALHVMKSWGFEYKTHAVWDKRRIGMGYWFRGCHELLLVGVKGSMSPPAQCARRSSIFKKVRSVHSKKPELVRRYLESAHPDLSKVEMFARSKVDGWDSWGNEIDSDVEIGSV